MSAPLRLADYDYALPRSAIAQAPRPHREDARLLVLDRSTGECSHAHVRDLPDLLQPRDLVVANATRVRRARLRGTKASGGRAEALLLGPAGAPDAYRALVKCRGRLREGLTFRFERAGAGAADARVDALGASGEVVLRFEEGAQPYALGEMPLPPYIERLESQEDDDERYQTVYAREDGSVAAPTAGLHLSRALLRRLDSRGVAFAEVILHVGAGTFRPVDDATLARGRLHAEAFELPEATVEAVCKARARGGRVIAVGTTTTRVLEHRLRDGALQPGRGETELLIAPGHRFQAIDALLTNFHLPRSSLLLLVCAFAGRERVLEAYAEAVDRGYRFYSYGDAMLILG